MAKEALQLDLGRLNRSYRFTSMRNLRLRWESIHEACYSLIADGDQYVVHVTALDKGDPASGFGPTRRSLEVLLKAQHAELPVRELLPTHQGRPYVSEVLKSESTRAVSSLTWVLRDDVAVRLPATSEETRSAVTEAAEFMINLQKVSAAIGPWEWFPETGLTYWNRLAGKAPQGAKWVKELHREARHIGKADQALPLTPDSRSWLTIGPFRPATVHLRENGKSLIEATSFDVAESLAAVEGAVVAMFRHNSLIRENEVRSIVAEVFGRAPSHFREATPPSPEAVRLDEKINQLRSDVDWGVDSPDSTDEDRLVTLIRETAAESKAYLRSLDSGIA